MSAPFNTVSWFQIGTTRPEDAQRFYGGLFGWTFAADPSSPQYDLISYAGADQPNGGVAHVPDAAAQHAIFLVMVEDVAATVAQAEELGGKVLGPPVTAPDGLVFAHLLDLSGNHFGVFTPPPGE